VAQNAAKHGDDPEFRDSAIKTVDRTACEMGDLIGRLSRRSPLLGRLEAVDVGALVEATAASLGPDFGAEIHRADEELPAVSAVPEQLQQVVLNLLLNAREATRSSSESTEAPIHVSIGRCEAGVSLEVADEGPGIPPERMRTLFQPFRSATPGGFGIGLYESKRIVESYGGVMRVDSSPGRGTRIIVELPAAATTESSSADEA
jgi:signal transduction histidine kinase